MDTQFFKNQLLKWYQSQRRDLPWRKTQEPYKIWLSEIILQQTRVIQGLPYYNRFIEHFPTVFDLANAEEEQVMKLWQGLGYYSRAKNLHHTAKKIAFDFDGVFPKSYEELIKLKGIGDYTASAIASICYSEPCAVVDGNVYRVLARVFNIETPINTSEGIAYFKELADSLLDRKDPGTYNQALMDFGAVQCKPQSPDCQLCVFSDKCLSNSLHKVSELPKKNRKIKITKRYFNYLVFTNKNGQTSLNKRIQKDIWQGLYEFPLIETSEEISHKEINERIKKEFDSLSVVYLYNEQPIVHKLSHQHIYTLFWIVETDDILSNCIDIKEVTSYPVSVLTANFIKEFWI